MTRSRRTPLLHFAPAIAAATLLTASLAACSSDDEAERDDGDGTFSRPGVSTSHEDGFLVQRFDTNGNGDADVIKYIEEYQSPDKPDVTKRRIRKKEVDVNGDDDIDIVKEYDKQGVPVRETVDGDLDGTMDLVRHFEDGELVRKESLADDGETVRTTRYYADDNLTRAEKDTDGDGKIDQWEYYSDGKLQRIGRDGDDDEEIDQWVYGK